MIPIRDENPTRRTPHLTWLLIAINVGIFLFEISLGERGFSDFTMRFGLIPASLTGGELGVARDLGGARGSLITPLTSMFMHGGWLHLIGNMWFLYIFGDNVEDTLGKARFLLFYIAGGLGAALMQIAIDPSSGMPMIGASGAISAVLAGYVRLHPHARIVTLVPIFIFIQFIELPAFLFIFIWFGLQLLSGMSGLMHGAGGEGGVAWWAHIGGFVVGFVLIRWMAADYFERQSAAKARRLKSARFERPPI